MAIEKAWIWVPGEEHESGLVVTDAETGEELLISDGRFAKIDLPRRSGGLYHPRAVRAEVVETDGQFATVKFANRRTARIKVQSKTQFTEDGKAPPPPKKPAISPSAKHGAW